MCAKKKHSSGRGAKPWFIQQIIHLSSQDKIITMPRDVFKLQYWPDTLFCLFEREEKLVFDSGGDLAREITRSVIVVRIRVLLQPLPNEYCRTHRHPTKPFVRTRRDVEGRREFWFCFLFLCVISSAHVLARNRRCADRGHIYPCPRDFRHNHTANNTFSTRQNPTIVTRYI